MTDPDLFGLLVENFFERWLKSHPAGVDHIHRYGIEAAVDHLFRLLNSGHLKIAANAEGDFCDVIPIDPPSPPSEPLLRPGRGQQDE